MALTENPEVAEDENIDNELLFNMLLLSEVNNSIPTFVYIFFRTCLLWRMLNTTLCLYEFTLLKIYIYIL